MEITKRSRSYWSTMFLNYPIFFLLVLLCSIVVLRCGANDCLTDFNNSVITGYNTLISPGRIFELGFFSPDESSNKSKYLGIWYYQSNPKIVVWVANRERPVLESNGFLVIRDGNGMVFDISGMTYWSTNSVSRGTIHSIRRMDLVNVYPNNTILYRLCLMDNGNFMLKDRTLGDKILWQSFDYPTDTFLPGMSIGGGINLTSWQNRNNPAMGNYTFQQSDADNELVITKMGSKHYWDSVINRFDTIPSVISELLFGNNGNTSQLEDYSNTRLVMNFTGQVQFWKNRSESLIWWEPKDRCSLYNACGNFGSCNSNNGLLCKCLPGFSPRVPEDWNSGNYYEGCKPRLEVEPCNRNFSQDVFLRMPMMKMGTPNYNETNGDEDCETLCRTDCTCVAYSCGGTNCPSNDRRCLMWNNELTDLQEEYAEGPTIFIRTAPSDIALTSRGCKPCGTYTIPYPLSTSPNCGDFSYFNFQCNASTGQVNFSTSRGTFKVTSIDPDAKMFIIQLGHANSCDSTYTDFVQSLKNSLLFNVNNCTIVKDQSFSEVEQTFVEVEMGWKPPLEPTCNASSDCRNWPHTTCKAAKGGKMRCICGSKFRWDGSQLKCVKVPLLLKVLVPCIAGGLAIILLCFVLFLHHTRKRRITERQGSAELMGDDIEGINVPFFDWGRLLAATNNFGDENKLGTGGFGSVYKGNLPDGKEIAVKRLSSVSVQGVEEFRTEVVLIAKLQHRNLVRLLGYCVKADEKILLYEYMPNGSLDSCLFDENFSVFLNWEKRFDIINGIARGLLYLHQDSRLRIIHRDLKPSNILLDEEMNPKISDFGIARIVGGKETEASTNRVVGTYGYMSPEYAFEGLFSIKSDVFSFGVVLLEIVSGIRNSRTFQLEHGRSLLGHAWRLWNEDKGLDLMDQTLEESCKQNEVLKCIHVGLLCVQEDPSDRPTMSNVVLMLSSENTGLSLPKQPAFITRRQPSETASSSSMLDSGLTDAITITLSTEGR